MSYSEYHTSGFERWVEKRKIVVQVLFVLLSPLVVGFTIAAIFLLIGWFFSFFDGGTFEGCENLYRGC